MRWDAKGSVEQYKGESSLKVGITAHLHYKSLDRERESHFLPSLISLAGISNGDVFLSLESFCIGRI